MSTQVKQIDPLLSENPAAANGSVEFFKSGTSTPKNYYDKDGVAVGSSANLNNYGRITGGAYGIGRYKIIFKNSGNSVIETFDNIIVGAQAADIGVYDIADIHGSYDDVAIRAAIAAIGSDKIDVLIKRHPDGTAWDTSTLSENLIFNINSAVKVAAGAILDNDLNGDTITIPNLVAGNYQVFDGYGTGDVTIGGATKEILPTWWGTNRTAVQSAFDALSGSNSIIQFIGNFTIEGAVTVEGSATQRMIHIRGTGQSFSPNPENFGAVIEHSGATNLLEFTNTSPNNIRVLIEDMVFVGDGSASLNALDFSDVPATNVAEWKVNRCQFYDFTKSIYGRGNIVQITNCSSTDAKTTHFDLTVQSIGCLIEGNRIKNTATDQVDGDGISVTGGASPNSMGVRILNNTVDKGGRAILVVDIKSGLIQGNYAESSAGAIEVNGSIDQSEGIVIIGNTTQSCQVAHALGTAGQIRIGKSDGCFIAGNTVRGGSTVAGIKNNFTGVGDSTNTQVGVNYFPDGHSDVNKYNDGGTETFRTQNPLFFGPDRAIAASAISLVGNTGDVFIINQGAGSVDLATINGSGWAGRELIILFNITGGGDVTVKNGTGNIVLPGGDVNLTGAESMQLYYDGTNWREPTSR